MPSKSIELINLHDATLENSVKFISSKLGQKTIDSQTLDYIEKMGGRRTDLELFIQKIKSGYTSQAAFNDIILKSLAELRKIGLGQGEFLGELKSPWDPTQFWILVELLAKNESVMYDDLKQHNLFKNNETPLQQMENYGLITIVQEEGITFVTSCFTVILDYIFIHS